MVVYASITFYEDMWIYLYTQCPDLSSLCRQECSVLEVAKQTKKFGPVRVRNTVM